MHFLWKGRDTTESCYYKHGFPPIDKFHSRSPMAHNITVDDEDTEESIQPQPSSSSDALGSITISSTQY